MPQQRWGLQQTGGVAIALSLVAGPIVADPATASLTVCNKSYRGNVYVAVAYPDGKGSWTTQGWFTLKQGECDDAIVGELKNQYYYYFADTDKDYKWQGTHAFCVSDRRFMFKNAAKQCSGANSRWEAFRELDTGKNSPNYTLDLR